MIRTKEEQIFLDSRDAKYNNDYDFFFQLKKTVERVKSISIQTYNIPYAFPNVNNYNNTIAFTETGHTMKTATISTGSYDTSSLILAIKSSLDTASSGVNTFTVTFSDVTNKFTISSNNTDFVLSYTHSSMRNMIGLTSDLTSSTRTMTMQTTVNLLTSTELRIHLSGLNNTHESISSSQNRSDMMMLIPLANCENYSYITNSYQSIEMQFTDLKKLNDLTVSIVDQTGFTPDLFDFEQYPFTLLLKVTIAL